MARVEVRQLRYRGESASAGRVEFAVADALRTEVVDDGRLVLVCSFRLGRIGLNERGASREVASTWRDIRETARHGGSSGAESANCVWFTDAAEARALLLRELAGGRTPFAWFWTLAVPDWRRETLGRWLERRLAEASRDASGELAAALVAEAVAGSCVEPLAAAILAQAEPVPAANPVAKVRAGRPSAATANTEAPPDRTPPAIEDAADRAVALAVVRSLPTPLRAMLAKVAARAELAQLVETLARGLVRRTHPALTLAPVRLVAIAAAVAQVLRRGEVLAVTAPVPSRRAGDNIRPVGAEPPGEDAVRVPDRAPGATSKAGAAEQATAPEGIASVPEPLPAPVEALATELRSAAAGLFLTIVPLIRLGWREWLAERPHLLVHQPGPRLLRGLAAHYRVPESDALWRELPALDPGDEPPPELEQALHLWRKGLDGWLRRKARLRLADLVLRQGWILPGGETTLVRFPLQTIEIRLRRLALDGDPGWVDWLGQSYRLVYRDRPLLGMEAG